MMMRFGAAAAGARAGAARGGIWFPGPAWLSTSDPPLCARRTNSLDDHQTGGRSPFSWSCRTARKSGVQLFRGGFPRRTCVAHADPDASRALLPVSRDSVRLLRHGLCMAFLTRLTSASLHLAGVDGRHHASPRGRRCLDMDSAIVELLGRSSAWSVSSTTTLTEACRNRQAGLGRMACRNWVTM